MITISVEQVKLLHKKLIEKTDGRPGVRKEGLIDSAMGRGMSTFDGEDSYKSHIEKISAITHSLISNHGFIDGNKRVGISVMLVLLKLNEIKIEYTQKNLIDLGLGVAASELEYEDIVEWLKVQSK
jgi:death-on-curing protein